MVFTIFALDLLLTFYKFATYLRGVFVHIRFIVQWECEHSTEASLAVLSHGQSVSHNFLKWILEGKCWVLTFKVQIDVNGLAGNKNTLTGCRIDDNSNTARGLGKRNIKIFELFLIITSLVNAVKRHKI